MPIPALRLVLVCCGKNSSQGSTTKTIMGMYIGSGMQEALNDLLQLLQLMARYARWLKKFQTTTYYGAKTC